MKKVLIVDDAAFMRLTIKEMLVKHDFEVHEAENGLDAVAKYKKPESGYRYNGYQLCRRCQAYRH